MSSSRRTLFWVTTTIVVVGAAGVGTALGIEHGKGHQPATSSQSPHTSAQPSPTSTRGQQISLHPCLEETKNKDKKPQTLPTLAGNPYGIDFSDTRLWLYSALESDAGTAVHMVTANSKSTCNVSYAEGHSGRVEIDDSSNGAGIEDYYGDSRDEQIQADICNAFPDLQDPKYGISNDYSEYGQNGCVPQNQGIVQNLNTASTPDDLRIGLYQSQSGQGNIFEENLNVTQSFPEWQLVIVHLNIPKDPIGPGADLHILSCEEPSSATDICEVSFEYALNQVIANDHIPAFSLAGTLADIKSALASS
jgi:hypothetical protein